MSDETKDWHKKLIDLVPLEDIDNGVWKDTILNYLDLTGDNRTTFLESVFQHVEEQRQFARKEQKNRRIYIGPGRDGSSTDKISIDCKFSPQNTGVTFNKLWKAQGFAKTTFAYVEEPKIDHGKQQPWTPGQGRWKVI